VTQVSSFAVPRPVTRRALVLAALGLVLMACSASRPASRPAGPSSTGHATLPVMPAASSGYTPFFLKDGLVSPGHRRVTDPKDPLGTALRTLIAGPDAIDQAAGLSTTLASDVAVDILSISKGVVTVDFSRAFESANTRPQVGEVVYTLTQFRGVRAVTFMVDGTANGAAGVGPQDRADLADMTPTVLPIDPAPADRLGRTFRCQGLTRLTGPTVCTVKVGNRTISSSSVGLPTTTSTTTTVLGVAGGTSPGSVEFNSLVTLAAVFHGRATIVVGPPKVIFGAPIATVEVTFG
jgi:Sporulation and spore germination